LNGKQGLFPSTYVEKLPPSTRDDSAASNSAATTKKPYKPFGAAYHGLNSPPPQEQGVNSIGLQEKEGTEAKKDKFGQYKNTVINFLFAFQSNFIHFYLKLAHSAVGGAGFGAGK
jgi:LAS seventeen-binding protein 1/2